MELLYAEDLVLVAETEELLKEKLRKWKRGMELKGLRVIIGKTKAMRCQVRIGQAEELVDPSIPSAVDRMASHQSELDLQDRLNNV